MKINISSAYITFSLLRSKNNCSGKIVDCFVVLSYLSICFSSFMIWVSLILINLYGFIVILNSFLVSRQPKVSIPSIDQINTFTWIELNCLTIIMNCIIIFFQTTIEISKTIISLMILRVNCDS